MGFDQVIRISSFKVAALTPFPEDNWSSPVEHNRTKVLKVDINTI